MLKKNKYIYVPFEAKGIFIPENKKGVIIIFLKTKYVCGLIALLAVVTLGFTSSVALGDTVDSPQVMKAYNVSLDGREYLQEGYVDEASWQVAFDSKIQEAQSLNDELISLSYYLSEENVSKLNNFNVDNFKYIKDVQSYIDEMTAVRDEILAQKKQDVESLAAKQKKIQDQQYSTSSGDTYYYSSNGVLTRSGGVNYFNGRKETWYNLNMNGVIANAQAMGIQGNYWVRGDGVKMYGDYVIVAAQAPKNTIIETSLGTGIVMDYCQAGTVDIATNWS